MGQEQGTPRHCDIEFLDRRIKELEGFNFGLATESQEQQQKIAELEAQVKDLTAIHGDGNYIHIKPENLNKIKKQAIETMLNIARLGRGRS